MHYLPIHFSFYQATKGLLFLIILNAAFDSSAQSLEFTWESGGDTIPGSIILGTLGVPAPSNSPGRRSHGNIGAIWVNGSSDVWLRGGLASTVMWKYDGTNWTWISGSNNITLGVYGTRNVTDPSNLPGSREGAATWKDESGNLWLFGGSSDPGYLNDLWKYDGDNWTWVSGNTVVNQNGLYGTKGVSNSSNIPGSRQAAAYWKDASGNLWLFGGAGGDDGTKGFTTYLNDLWKYDGTNWTWMAGGSTGENAGVYGTQGVANASNIPGARVHSAFWADGSGNLWLFGGYGYDINGSAGIMNDLWKFDGTNWTWISGSNTFDPGDGSKGGAYGTKGVADPANVPGARRYAATWLDGSGNLWMFGGSGYDEEGLFPLEPLNDLWKFDGANWTWISGNSDPGDFGDYSIYGTRGVASPDNMPGSRTKAIGWIDDTENLWLFGGVGIEDGSGDDLWKFDGTNWTWVDGKKSPSNVGSFGAKGVPDPSNHPDSRYDAVSWMDSSGNLWLFGGNSWNGTLIDTGLKPFGAMNDLWKYDGSNWTWMSGGSNIYNIGVYGSKGVADAANIPGSRTGSVTWVDESDNLWLFGGSVVGASGAGGVGNDLWKFDGSNWTWVSGNNTLNNAGVYGTKGVADPSNVPGGRISAISWKDALGNFWLFGGVGLDASGSAGLLNDLWKYDGTNWTWVSGSDTKDSSGDYGTKGVPASSNVPRSRYRAVSWIDKSGDFWLFGGANRFGESFSDLWRYDGTNWTWVSGIDSHTSAVYGTKGVADASNTPGSRIDAVSWTGESGDLWLFGGFGNDIWKFDGTNWTWISGNKKNSGAASRAAIYGTKGMASSSNIPGARSSSVVWSDGTGDVWLFGGRGFDGTGTLEERLNDLWRITFKELQTITFGELPAKIFCDPGFELTAASTSGLPVSFSSSNEAVAVINGSTLTIVGAGETTITASQAGDGDFDAAPDVEQILVVSKAPQTITFAELADVNLSAGSITLAATASSGLAVDLSAEGPVTLEGTTLHLTGAGEVTVTASQAGNSNYLAAEPVIRTFTVTDDTDSRQSQTITFSLPESIYEDEGPVTLEGASSSGLEVSYEVVEGPATLEGNILTITGAGTVQVKAEQAGNDEYKPAEAITSTLLVKALLVISGSVSGTEGESLTGVVQALTTGGGVSGSSDLDGNNFTIAGLRDGDYYVRVIPAEGSLSSYYLTYYPGALQWTDATTVTIAGENLSGVSWEAVPKPGTSNLTGQGVIKGRVIADDSAEGSRIIMGRIYDGGTPLDEITVYLLKAADGSVFTEAITDVEGNFEMTGLPSGSYQLFVDVPGISMDPATSAIELGEKQTIELTAVVGENGVATEQMRISGLSLSKELIKIFPNPANDFVTIEVADIYSKAELTINLFNLLGQKMISTTSGGTHSRLDLADVQQGVYLLAVQNKEGEILKLMKMKKE